MTAIEILNELECRGVHLEVAGDKLRFRPKDAVPAEMVEALRERKPEILAVLQTKRPATGYGLCPGSEKCAGCYSVGMVDGRERFIHPPKGKPIDWTTWKPATERVQ